MDELNLPWVEKGMLPWERSNGSYIITVELSAYSLETIMKTCYLFLDQCFLFVQPTAEGRAVVYFTPTEQSNALLPLIGEFSNRLIWQETRRKIASETSAIRNLIVAQAFAEAEISAADLTEADYNLDPARIAD